MKGFWGLIKKSKLITIRGYEKKRDEPHFW